MSPRWSTAFFLLLMTTLLCACAVKLEIDTVEAPSHRPPNFVVIFADDLGYGDLACFGHPTIATPHLDRMATEGQKWTQFYVGANVCTPSRAALLTGRLPIRSGMCSSKRRVLFPNSGGGLPASEITIAEALKPAGYATGAFGKWHLGHLPQFLPTAHGFDTYWGIPYSNDMDKVDGPNYNTEGRKDANYLAETKYFNVPILYDVTEVERPADQLTITRRYTDHAVDFIRQNKDKPFFVYLAHSLPHIPLFASKDFLGTSRRGLFGDVVQEVDASVGRVLDTLRELKLDKNTVVVFTSDNGPWLTFATHGGSAGLLRGGKGGPFEGGQREPTIFWGPGIVKPRVVRDLGATMDLLPTFCTLAGVPLPNDRLLDGADLSPALKGTGSSSRDTMFYYRGTDIWAVRHGDFKAHFTTREPEYGKAETVQHDPPLLYHLGHDPSEQYDVAAQHPDVIAQLKAITEAHRKTIKPVVNQLEIPLPK